MQIFTETCHLDWYNAACCTWLEPQPLHKCQKWQLCCWGISIWSCATSASWLWWGASVANHQPGGPPVANCRLWKHCWQNWKCCRCFLRGHQPVLPIPWLARANFRGAPAGTPHSLAREWAIFLGGAHTPLPPSIAYAFGKLKQNSILPTECPSQLWCLLTRHWHCMMSTHSPLRFVLI